MPARPPGSPTPRLKPPWGWVPGRQLHTVSFVVVHARLVSLPLPGGTGGGCRTSQGPKPLPQACSPEASGSSFPQPLDAASGPATWREARSCLAPCPPRPASRTPRRHVASTFRPPRSPPLEGGRCPGTPSRAPCCGLGFVAVAAGPGPPLSVVGGLTLVALRAGLAGLVVGGLVVVASFALAAPGVLGPGAAALHPEPCRRWACEGWPGPRSLTTLEHHPPRHPEPSPTTPAALHPLRVCPPSPSLCPSPPQAPDLALLPTSFKSPIPVPCPMAGCSPGGQSWQHFLPRG